MGAKELLVQLRGRLGDDRFNVPAFVLSCLDPFATDCFLEVQNGFLRTTLFNAGADATELNFNLGAYTYQTLGQVRESIEQSHSRTYRLVPASDVDEGHPALDIEQLRRTSIRGNGVTLHTRRFADAELETFLLNAARRHNANYTLSNIPLAEQGMVCSLAHADVLRALASDSSKRRGLDADVDALLKLADAYERSYKDDVKRNMKALKPIRSDDDGIREGDVVVGEFVRRSLRTGYQSHSSANLRANPPLLFSSEDRDIEDLGCHVRWRRSRHPHIHALELWRDTVPDVKRSRDENIFPTTSTLVWDSRRSNNREYGQQSPAALMERASWGTHSEAGNLVSAIFDGFSVPPVGQPFDVETANALEPETTYYWRLYLVDTNGEWVASDVVSAKTLRERARYSRTSGVPALSVTTGPIAGGTAITIKGKNFTASNGPTVSIGGKACTSLVVVDSETITCESPATSEFAPRKQDVVLLSNSGLRDLVIQGWTYTA